MARAKLYICCCAVGAASFREVASNAAEQAEQQWQIWWLCVQSRTSVSTGATLSGQTFDQVLVACCIAGRSSICAPVQWLEH